jgi:hypothetical protein
MRKTMEWLKRGFLVLGVVVALTPCGLCHASSQTNLSQVKTCDMGPMEGMKCCHAAKSQSPLCKIMGQSSVVSASHVSSLVVVPVVAAPLAVAFLPAPTFTSSAFSRSFASPPRGPLSLRI